jgi:hypothetical protein
MSFAFPAYHICQQTTTLPVSQAKTHAKAVAGLIEWRLVSETETELHFIAPLSSYSWGEKISVEFDGQSIRLRSRCRWFLQCFDFGKNAKNCDGFFALFTRTTKS